MSDLRRLLPFLRPYRAHLLGVFALLLGGVAVGLAWPLVARAVVDDLVAGHRPQVLGLAGLALAGLVLGGGGRVLYLVTAARLLTDMRQHLFRHVLGLPTTVLTRSRRGDLATRLQADLAEAQRAMTDVLLQVALTAVGLVASLGLMFWLDARMTLATLALAPVLLASALAFRGPVARAARVVRDDSSDMLSFVVEGLDRVRLTQAYAAQEGESGRYRALIERFMGDLLRFQWVSLAAAGAPGVLLAVAGLLVLVWGGGRVAEGTMTLGTLLAYGAYQVRFFGPLQDLVRGVVALARAGASVRRVVELLDLPSESSLAAPVPTVAPSLALEEVTFGYAPGRPVVQDFSLRVAPGEVVALVGPNGAGKSTVAHLLLGFDRPWSGRILLDGREALAAEARAALTLVPQDPMLLHATVAENLRWAVPSASCEDLEEAARRAGCLEWIRSLPEGWDTVVGERGHCLSDGQRQRLALARGLLRRTPVLVLDEATSAIDLAAEEALWAGLREGGGSLLLLAHRPSTVARADRVVTLP